MMPKGNTVKLFLNALLKFTLGLALYPATLLMFLPLPLILGSLWGVIPFALYPILIIIRIYNEERVLAEGLAGYAEYQQQVRYRLFPFLW